MPFASESQRIWAQAIHLGFAAECRAQVIHLGFAVLPSYRRSASLWAQAFSPQGHAALSSARRSWHHIRPTKVADTTFVYEKVVASTAPSQEACNTLVCKKVGDTTDCTKIAGTSSDSITSGAQVLQHGRHQGPPSRGHSGGPRNRRRQNQAPAYTSTSRKTHVVSSRDQSQGQRLAYPGVNKHLRSQAEDLNGPNESGLELEGFAQDTAPRGQISSTAGRPTQVFPRFPRRQHFRLHEGLRQQVPSGTSPPMDCSRSTRGPFARPPRWTSPPTPALSQASARTTTPVQATRARPPGASPKANGSPTQAPTSTCAARPRTPTGSGHSPRTRSRIVGSGHPPRIAAEFRAQACHLGFAGELRAQAIHLAHIRTEVRAQATFGLSHSPRIRSGISPCGLRPR